MMKEKQQIVSYVLLLVYVTTGFIIFSSRQPLISSVNPDGKETIEFLSSNGFLHVPAQKNQGGLHSQIADFRAIPFHKYLQISFSLGEKTLSQLEYSRLSMHIVDLNRSHIQYIIFKIIFPSHYFL